MGDLLQGVQGVNKRKDWLCASIIALALGYALFAGLRTVSDFDLGWQLATGRYLVAHHQVPRTELFSYTAHGREWIYPPFSGVIFYLLYLVGGYVALTWLGAFACATAVGFLCSDGSRLTAALAIVAVPALTFRTNPRAELFTTVLFAAVLTIIWRHHLGKSVPLWPLPAIFLVWPNLHLGFISGLAILGAGILFEICDVPFSERRAIALGRLKHLAPWVAASLVATLLNPWGWRIYEAIYRQNKVMQLHSAFIGEWSSAHFNSLAWRQALNARDPGSGEWWLLGVGAVAVLVALSKIRLGPAIVLAGATYLSVAHIRFQALFAIVAVSIGGALLSELARPDVAPPEASRSTGGAPTEKLISLGTVSTRLAALSAAILTLFVGLRIADLVSDRYYVDSGHLSLFGTGPSWWYPERAAAFLEREHLPGNIFHDYNLGGYLTWRIGPQYADFVDGRYIPFGQELFDEQRLLMSLGPDSAEWKQAAERWQINTLIFPVARYAGLGSFPLQDFCNSKLWKLVYLDHVSVIFLRNRPENSEFIKRFDLRCESAAFAPPSLAEGNSFRARAERFNYLMNTGSIFYSLSRDAEASSALQQAEKLFPDNPNLHFVRAQLFGATNRLEEAEREYLRVLRSSPSDAAWYALARLYAGEHRYSDAVRCITEAVPISQVPYERLRSLGTLYVYMDQPESALAAFDRANQNSPYRGDSSDLGKQFNAQLAEGRARAYRQMNDLSRAVAEQESAVRLGAGNPARWIALADLYQAQGQPEKSLRARERAKSMQKETAGMATSLEPSSTN